MRSRILRLLIVALALAALSPAAIAAAAPGDTSEAAANPPTPAMSVLSSFTPQIHRGIIVGGTRTVTVHNLGDGDVTTTVDLAPVPCQCIASAVVTSHGTTVGSIWVIDALPEAQVATLTVTYVAALPASGGVRAHITESFGDATTSAGHVLRTTGAGGSRHIAV